MKAMKTRKTIKLLLLSLMFVVVGFKQDDTQPVKQDSAQPMSVELTMLDALLNDTTVQKFTKDSGDNCIILDLKHFLHYDSTTVVKLENHKLQVVPTEDRIVFLSGKKLDEHLYKVHIELYTNYGDYGGWKYFDGVLREEDGEVKLVSNVLVCEI